MASEPAVEGRKKKSIKKTNDTIVVHGGTQYAYKHTRIDALIISNH